MSIIKYWILNLMTFFYGVDEMCMEVILWEENKFYFEKNARIRATEMLFTAQKKYCEAKLAMSRYMG